MWIKNRIDTEYKKHKSLDWSRLAEAKILSTFNDKVKKLKEEFRKRNYYMGDIHLIFDKIFGEVNNPHSVKGKMSEEFCEDNSNEDIICANCGLTKKEHRPGNLCMYPHRGEKFKLAKECQEVGR